MPPGVTSGVAYDRAMTRLAALSLVLALPASVARADTFDLTALDKRAHMATSYALTLSVDVVARRFELPRWQAALLGAATTIVVGTAKELVLDDDYDWGDQLANGIGITTATLVVFAFEL